METSVKLYFNDSKDLSFILDNSIDLIVTSPPYPMIEMWDEIFSNQDRKIKDALDNGDGGTAFDLMHNCLDQVWKECWRILKPGGIALVNIGDGVRKIGELFSLFPNHSRIINAFNRLGFNSLPCILWRKQTNAPNKFMGSGMLPPGAYVTLEHEYILIFRKGEMRKFLTPAEKKLRQESAYFWEERNIWFSDIWDFKGARQKLDNNNRERSGAFPFELAYRLINMYSVKGDIVFDPFLGTGTSACASIVSGRNFIGNDIDESLKKLIDENILGIKIIGNEIIRQRLGNHLDFIKSYSDKGTEARHFNEVHNFPVITSQEKSLKIDSISEVVKNDDCYIISYENPTGNFSRKQ